MTQYKQVKRELMKAFNVNSVALDEAKLKIASKESNMHFTAGTEITMTTSTEIIYKIHLFSDSIGNCYYTAESENEPISFHYKNEVWRGFSYNIRHTTFANFTERKIYNIICGNASHLGH